MKIPNNLKVLIVIPARGGSKGIPRKNLRKLNGKSLICYALDNAKKCFNGNNIDIVVSTEDDEIMDFVYQYGFYTIKRPIELAQDHVTIDPVVYHSLNEMEQQKKCKYDIVVTMQATSPLLKSSTIENAICTFNKDNNDTLISVVNRPHLTWKIEDNQISPNYTKRLNRQQLPPCYTETGGFLITKREFVLKNNRFGKRIGIYEVSEEEAIDIDSELDWLVCESVLKRKRILFRVDAEGSLGMGHVYRCLTLAYHMTGHIILFVSKASASLGIEKLKASNFNLKSIDTEEELFQIINDFKPDIIINDILNTQLNYIKRLKKYDVKVINFEDQGEGAIYADKVINALYEENNTLSNEYNGFNYFFIRDEFLDTRPKQFQNTVNNILFMFGGSDPSNLTKQTYDICKQIYVEYPDIEFHFITGIGYIHKETVVTDESCQIYVHNNVNCVSKYMAAADLAVTSQGRTIYELACMGVPSIVLAQNERETRHVFANIKNGFINLGIGNELDTETIKSTIKWLIETPQIRKEMRNLLLSKEFKEGQKRVLKLILE